MKFTPVGLYIGCRSSKSPLFEDPAFTTDGGDRGGGVAGSVADERSVGAVLVVGAAAGGGQDSLFGFAIDDRVRSGGKDLAY